MTTPEDLANTHSKSLINLLRGWPSTTLLPTEAISHAAQSVLADKSIAYPGLLYGPDAGHPPLRSAIAEWLTGFYGPPEPITQERITITGGASQNLGVLLQVFTDPIYTRYVFMIAPAYMLAFRVFQDNGFAGRLKAVPEDEEGIDLDSLRRQLEESEAKIKHHGNPEAKLKPDRPYSKYYRHVIYCVPTFANPSSRTMSLSHRQGLVRLAREFDALIIADDVYDQLQWPSAAPAAGTTSLSKAHLPRLSDIDRTLDGGVERDGSDGFGNAMSNGSFSKICGPGIRVGWAEGTPKFAYGVSQAGTSCSGGAPSQLTSTYIAHLVQHGTLQKHIHGTLQPAYGSRYRTLTSAVDEYLIPLGVNMPQRNRDVAGGFFVLLALPDSVDADAFAKRCKEEENVVVAPGSMFQVPGDDSVTFEHCVRLCFAWESEEKLTEGVKRMGAVLNAMLKRKPMENVNGAAKEGNDAQNFW